MKFGSKRAQGSDSATTGEPVSGGVTDQNYADIAVRFMAGREGFVIRSQEPSDNRQPTPAQWRAWLEYFSDRKVKTTFMRQHGVATVPTEWPEDFDMTAPLSDRLWTPLPPMGAERAPTIDERRANVQRLNGMLDKAFKPLPNDHRRKSPLEHAAPVRPAIDLTSPLTVSDALRQTNAVRDLAILNAGE